MSCQLAHRPNCTSHQTFSVQISQRAMPVNCRAKHVAAIARKLGNNKGFIRLAILAAIKLEQVYWKFIKRYLCSRLHILLTQALCAATVTAVPAVLRNQQQATTLTARMANTSGISAGDWRSRLSRCVFATGKQQTTGGTRVDDSSSITPVPMV